MRTLRFRWRGDGLEMKTLRKLARSISRGGNGATACKTLRVATQNSQRRLARGPRRTICAPPSSICSSRAAPTRCRRCEALALFYDNIDLTPIGPDGDEMIRRMADRLVAVDLLGPAANLLAYQVDKRLDGVAKAQVATKLAAIYLMDHKPRTRARYDPHHSDQRPARRRPASATAAGGARLRRSQAMGQCARPDRGRPGRRTRRGCAPTSIGKAAIGRGGPEGRGIAFDTSGAAPLR